MVVKRTHKILNIYWNMFPNSWSFVGFFFFFFYFNNLCIMQTLQTIYTNIVYCITQPLEFRDILAKPPAVAPSPSPNEHVFVRIIIRSVRILGRRTFGATTPQASLKRRCFGRKKF